MNKTIVVISLVVMAAIMFVGVVVIALYRPDATATIISFVGTFCAIALNSALVLYNVTKVRETTTTIERQTNGANTALLAHINGEPMSAETIDLVKGVSHARR